MVTTDRLQVNIRLERELLAELDEMAGAENLDRTELARRLLREGLRRERLDIAVRRYREREVSASRAAEMARVSLYEMLDRIHEEGIPYEVVPELFGRLDEMVAGRRGKAAVREESVGYGAPPRADATELPAGAGESRGDAVSYIDELRAQFRPDQVRWLFVGESSPAGGTHFYRANSNLFRATQEAFAQALGAGVPSGPAFLHFFRQHGAWLVDLADRPVNRMEGRSRNETVKAGVERLSRLIAESRPERIFVVKASIAPAVRHAATAAGSDSELVELPFPVRQWRSAYIRELAAAIGETDLSDDWIGAAVGSLHRKRSRPNTEEIRRDERQAEATRETTGSEP